MPVSEQGVDREGYRLIPRVLIFVRRGDSVLLIRGHPQKPLWANKYNGLGGHIERGEDVLSGGQRELLEESGIQADLWLCGTLIVDVEQGTGVGLYILTGEYLGGEPQPSSEGTLEWVNFDQLTKKPLVDDVAVILARIRDMQRGDAPFAARSYYQDGKLTIEFYDNPA